mmetsp:Transcript_46625/g.132954  ORF Transcript_46625/g.132954 Transcript_46625/m.132954 type:complete len:295 (-) Transcript_46625:335-1219(-)
MRQHLRTKPAEAVNFSAVALGQALAPSSLKRWQASFTACGARSIASSSSSPCRSPSKSSSKRCRCLGDATPLTTAQPCSASTSGSLASTSSNSTEMSASSSDVISGAAYSLASTGFSSGACFAQPSTAGCSSAVCWFGLRARRRLPPWAPGPLPASPKPASSRAASPPALCPSSGTPPRGASSAARPSALIRQLSTPTPQEAQRRRSSCTGMLSRATKGRHSQPGPCARSSAQARQQQGWPWLECLAYMQSMRAHFRSMGTGGLSASGPFVQLKWCLRSQAGPCDSPWPQDLQQ